MKSPQDMQFIQIDITNACNLRCSNCTRFCGNHKSPFVMDMETFRRAVDSHERRVLDAECMECDDYAEGGVLLRSGGST